MMILTYRLPVLALAAIVGAAAWADLPISPHPLWQPIADEAYLQEVGRRIETSAPLTAAAVYSGSLYVGGPSGVSILDGIDLRAVNAPVGSVRRLKSLEGGLWAVADGALWRSDGHEWVCVGGEAVYDLCSHNGAIVVAAGAQLFRVDGDALSPITESPSPRPILGVASYAGTVYVNLGDRIGLLEKGAIVTEYLADWGKLFSGCTIRDIATRGSRLVLATDEGLAVLRGMTWYLVQGEDGLCVEDTTCLALGFDHDLWVGSTGGAMREVGDTYQFFGYQRWIPDNKVNAIAVGDRTVYIATDGGLGIIEYEPFTLLKKAAWYERWIEEWGQKRLGFVHSLVKDGQTGEWLRHVSDNDVGYSSHYLDALCFKYAVTGDPDVRAAAVDMMKSVTWSEAITPMDGFPARSIWAVGEAGDKAKHGSGGLPAEWHATDDGLWEWKGDTSSDETDAHVYETSLFLELVAQGAERDAAIEHLGKVVGHIVDNGWLLRDLDGQPTRWARWDPEYLQRPYGFYARGLNGLEALNYATTAYHFTNDAKFKDGKGQLIAWAYPDEVLRQKLTFHPGYFTHFDDRLAFYSYFPLLRYETDPDLRALGRRSLERSWEVKRIEGLPWFNYIYAAITGNDCENDRAVAHLREWPLDCVSYSYHNSHRDDLFTPKGYRMYAERAKPLSPRETGPHRWDADFMQLDGGGGGNSVEDPTGWLDAYWMGRYYGLIEAPTVDDPALTTVAERNLQLGAKPYEGPPRPEMDW